METTKVGQHYVNALKKRYEADMEEAKANLSLYTTNLVGIGEHSDLPSPVLFFM